jgi:two-component system cell cycle response regulator
MSMNAKYSKLIAPLVVVLLTACAFVAVTLLISHVDSGRRDQLAIGSLRQTVKNLEAAPFSADQAFSLNPAESAGGLAASVAGEIRGDERTLRMGLTRASEAGADRELIVAGRSSVAAVTPAVAAVYALAIQPGGLAGAGVAKVAPAQAQLARRMSAVSTVLGQLDRGDAAGAKRSHNQADAGTAIAMLLLLAAFAFFYFRSERLARENENLLGLSREEASTDVLTGLGNRRALMDELDAAIERHAPKSHELLVAIFDLDGFKEYNDTYGHAAGDALLARLGLRLSAAVERCGTTYRMGGDEFCMLATCAADAAEGMLDRALTALTDRGEGWEIGCSHGGVWVPSEAASAAEALQIADVRMYANKATRSSTGRQITDVLLQVLSEQDQGMNEHGDHVAALAAELSEALHQPVREVQRIRLAATLHDIGKTAIPESVLNKPGPLDSQDWEFLRRHTLIGERIVLAAPALASTAPLIRSSHERLDGSGYPDGLSGEGISLGARIIAVCVAYDAMTSARSYRTAGTVEGALHELQRCAGSQFDPAVVAALTKLVQSKRARSSIGSSTSSNEASQGRNG